MLQRFYLSLAKYFQLQSEPQPSERACEAKFCGHSIRRVARGAIWFQCHVREGESNKCCLSFSWVEWASSLDNRKQVVSLCWGSCAPGNKQQQINASPHLSARMCFLSFGAIVKVARRCVLVGFETGSESLLILTLSFYHSKSPSRWL